MKRILMAVAVIAFATSAAVVYAQAQVPQVVPTAPKVEAKTPAPAPVAIAPAAETAKKDANLEVTDICKKKGLAGDALAVCVKDELAKIQKTPAVENVPVLVKTTTPAAPTAKPAETKK